MTDTLTKAKELIERFDGKITAPNYNWHHERGWSVEPCCEPNEIPSIHLGVTGNTNRLDGGHANNVDIEAMSSVPQMLTIIKDLVELLTGEHDDYRNIYLSGKIVGKTINEDKALTVLKSSPKLIRDYVKGLKSVLKRQERLTFDAIAELRTLSQQNQALKDRIAKLEGSK